MLGIRLLADPETALVVDVPPRSFLIVGYVDEPLPPPSPRLRAGFDGDDYQRYPEYPIMY